MDTQKTVVVRRQWNDWRNATYRLTDLQDVHWDYLSGGVRASAPWPVLSAYVICDAALEGEVAHSGLHGACPHRIKVAIIQKDNARDVVALLRAQTGPKPPSLAALRRKERSVRDQGLR
jgi:hypothetical protein